MILYKNEDESIRLKLYTPSAGNFETLREMVFALYDEDREGLPMTEEKLSATVDRHLQTDKVRILTVECDHKMAGYAIFTYTWSNEQGGEILTIDELYVKPRFRGRGAGTMVLTYALEAEQPKAVRLETTPANEKARQMYTARGFRETVNTELIYVKSVQSDKKEKKEKRSGKRGG